jgi:hypothetical protein
MEEPPEIMVRVSSDLCFPLIIQVVDKWKLSFRLLPYYEIVFEGEEMPPTEELVEILKNINAPMWTIKIFQIIIGDCLRRKSFL